MDDLIQHRRQQVLYDQKWFKFLRRAWIWRYLPFLDFVLAAGSLATGNIHRHSDFDVLISVRSGRIFTVRALAVLILGLLGWRRRKLSHQEEASDKICLNHFVTDQSWRLSPPHGFYWQKLYQNLVPVFGAPMIINGFWKTNQEWMGKGVVCREDLRYAKNSASGMKKVLEAISGGRLGSGLEKILKSIQIKRIEKSLKTSQSGYQPRIKYSDEELEFHPDTYRTTLWK